MNFLYVANWKMYLSFDESINFCLQNYARLEKLFHNADIIICPSFVALTSIIKIFKNSTISIGAQNCSEHISGPYTGQISARMLAQAKVKYCLVGHSEQRIDFQETANTISKKIKLLYQENIQPIICIGEIEKQQNNYATYTILEQQLEPIIKTVQKIAGSLRIRKLHKP